MNPDLDGVPTEDLKANILKAQETLEFLESTGMDEYAILATRDHLRWLRKEYMARMSPRGNPHNIVCIGCGGYIHSDDDAGECPHCGRDFFIMPSPPPRAVTPRTPPRPEHDPWVHKYDPRPPPRRRRRR